MSTYAAGEFRCRLIIDGRREWAPTADTPQRAKRIAQALADRIADRQPVTIEDALARYADYKTAKGNKPRSLTTTDYRLRSFFPRTAMSVQALTPAKCAEYYAALTAKQKPDTHQNALAEARTFCSWLVKQQLIKRNPIDGIEPMGRRKHGKAQLTVEEAHRWLSHARTVADKGEAGAVAAMVTLLMGLRCGEIVERTARDLDAGGSLLWIPHSKTEAGRRRVEVPDVLRLYLLALKRDKLPTDLLFGEHWRDWPRRWVQKICRAARVPTVCAHSMRGLFATLGMQAGAVPHVVAATLGHESPRITEQSYAQPGSADIVPARRAVAQLLPV